MYYLKTKDQIQKIRTSCQIVGEILSHLIEEVCPGMTTNDLDARAHELTLKKGAKPAFLGYHDFPKVLCTSVNEEVVHGIPDDRILKEGDIVGIDFGVVKDGWFGDSAVTLPVGNISPEAKKLIKVTEESLYKAIDAAKEGRFLGDIGYAVQKHAESHGYGIVREFVGHGIGKALHEDPQVPNWGKQGSGLELQAGLVLAIEPMVTAGSPKIKMHKNRWTALTADASFAAHFEHTIVITEKGPIILSDRQTL